LEVIDSAPEQRYLLAVDDGKNTLYEITKAIADGLSQGIVHKVSKEEAFLEKTITQSDFDMLTTNLRLEPVFLKEAGLELKYEVAFTLTRRVALLRTWHN
jgi:adenylate kinase